MPSWDYDPGEHRVKHCWNKPVAAIVQNGSTFTGKCPSTLSKALAKTLLNDGFFTASSDPNYPQWIYNIHDGVVYEAMYSGQNAYHGYPWMGRPGRNRIPRDVKQRLLDKAETMGCAKAIRDWMDRYGA